MKIEIFIPKIFIFFKEEPNLIHFRKYEKIYWRRSEYFKILITCLIGEMRGKAFGDFKKVTTLHGFLKVNLEITGYKFEFNSSETNQVFGEYQFNNETRFLQEEYLGDHLIIKVSDNENNIFTGILKDPDERNKIFWNDKLIEIPEEIKQCIERKLDELFTQTITLNSPWFEYVKFGIKKYEGRNFTNSMKSLKVGDKLMIKHHTKNRESYKVVIINILHFKNFEEAMTTLSLKKILPNVESIEQGVKIYEQYVSIKTQNKNGIIMIELKLDKDL